MKTSAEGVDSKVDKLEEGGSPGEDRRKTLMRAVSHASGLSSVKKVDEEGIVMPQEEGIVYFEKEGVVLVKGGTISKLIEKLYMGGLGSGQIFCALIL